MDTHPVRLVVRDDLERSRATVFFRLLLAIPHLIWLAVWTAITVVVAIVNWAVVLVRGRSPKPIHSFLSEYVGYVSHLGAYLTLAANPYPHFDGQGIEYPVYVEIDGPERQRRWTVAVRIVLALPALVLSSLLGNLVRGLAGFSAGSNDSSTAGVAPVAAFLGWFASVFTGKMPLGLRNIGAYAVGYQAQTLAYLLCLTDRYPYSGPEPGSPVSPVTWRQPAQPAARLVLRDDLVRSRLTVLFRIVLLVPHAVWGALWGVAAVVAAILGWAAVVATGKLPRPLHRFLAAYIRYLTHVGAFAMLVGNPFPGFAGTPGSYPVDADIDGPAAQSRGTALVRIILAVPALMLGGAIGFAGWGAAILMWLVGLVLGRAPQGLRNVGAWSIRYSLESYAYLALLTDRYPYSGPEAGFPPLAEDAQDAAEPAGDDDVQDAARPAGDDGAQDEPGPDGPSAPGGPAQPLVIP